MYQIFFDFLTDMIGVVPSEYVLYMNDLTFILSILLTLGAIAFGFGFVMFVFKAVINVLYGVFK